VEPRRAQARVLLERLAHEVLVRVELGRPHRPRAPREAVTLDGQADGVVVDAQLGGDRADRPVLGEEEAPNARVQLDVDHRATSKSRSWRRSRKSPMPVISS